MMLDSLWPTLRQQVKSWVTQSQTVAIPEDDRQPLPDPLVIQLAQRLQSLPPPQAYQTHIQHAIGSALATWQQTLDAPNHLIILGHPVEAIAQIVQTSVQNWTDAPPLEVLTPLACASRPPDPLAITQQIQQALQPYAHLDLGNVNAKDTDEWRHLNCLDQRTTLMLIPSLDQCFLRCIEGWEGIEFLRDRVIRNPHCFWVMGCNHWAWNFLDFVGQVSAYFSEVEALPKLDGAMLKDWLAAIAPEQTGDLATPVMQPEETGTPPAPDHDHAASPKNRPPSTATDPDTAYWDDLASQAIGVSQIAAALWLQSLRLKTEAESDELLSSRDGVAKLQQGLPSLAFAKVKPSLPSLPSLTSSDRHLLHAILIHGQMTRAHLAHSFGEPESQIQARIQWLLREGLLTRHQGALSVQAAHYIKLKRELANNNFFVGKD